MSEAVEGGTWRQQRVTRGWVWGERGLETWSLIKKETEEQAAQRRVPGDLSPFLSAS